MNDIQTAAKEEVRKNRLAFLETQISDTRLNIAIYKAMYESHGQESDKNAAANEENKLERLLTALAVVNGGDW